MRISPHNRIKSHGGVTITSNSMPHHSREKLKDLHGGIDTPTLKVCLFLGALIVAEMLFAPESFAKALDSTVKNVV